MGVLLVDHVPEVIHRVLKAPLRGNVDFTFVWPSPVFVDTLKIKAGLLNAPTPFFEGQGGYQPELVYMSSRVANFSSFIALQLFYFCRALSLAIQ